MGIVVSIAMFLGLVQMFIKRSPLASLVAGGLLALGIWNAAWYGLRHLTEFWGMAAISSGLAMIAAAIIVAGEARTTDDTQGSPLHKIYRIVIGFRTVILFALLASFLLYAITLVRLNLGMPIIS